MRNLMLLYRCLSGIRGWLPSTATLSLEFTSTRFPRRPQAVPKAAAGGAAAPAAPLSPEQLTHCLVHAVSQRELQRLCAAHCARMTAAQLAAAAQRAAMLPARAGDAPLALLEGTLVPRLTPLVGELTAAQAAGVAAAFGRLAFACQPGLLSSLAAAVLDDSRAEALVRCRMPRLSM